MSKIQTSQEKKQARQVARRTRVRLMLQDIAHLIYDARTECRYKNVSVDDKDNYRKVFKQRLESMIQYRVLYWDDTSWSFNDITMFLNGIEYEVTERDEYREKFQDIRYKYGKKFNWDYKACPFGLLYNFLLDVIFVNQNLILEINNKIIAKEQERIAEKYEKGEIRVIETEEDMQKYLAEDEEDEEEIEAQKQAETEARLKEEAESIVREAKAKTEITEDEKWQTINEQNWETAMNEARAEMEVIA